MYFRQIEMIGFKSFADRTLVNLEAGMTAIVGPNGCGKSNILDAMRWALGEQSAKALRGAHMQDVIFSGSEQRAPTGMAEVTLTFDNSDNVLPLDFSEVQVSRRVYRSGESEYLINKAPCRLRDVQELFMDTGIGTNAYSMIGQGKIDLVLSSKPEDRRFLFEEAAGIIKYKSRKRIAMRKLEQAEQNLLRLNDIVAEVERQMRSLKRQVNAAIRYRELKEQLQQLEVRAAWLKHVYLSAAIADLKERFKTAQDAFEKHSTDTSRLEARFEELNLNKLEIDRVLHARREGVHEIDSEMEKIERQIALIRQQIEFSGEQQKRAAAEREAYLGAAESIKAQQTDATARAEQLRLRMDAAREAMAAKQAEHDLAAARVGEADQRVEAARARSVETMGLRARTQTAIETLAVNIANIDAQLEKLYTRQEAENARRNEIAGELDELRRKETERQSEAGGLAEARRAAAEQEAAAAKRVVELNEQWQSLREKKSSLEGRLNSLRELRDSYEGFASGVKAIMGAKQQPGVMAEGIIGPVGDLVSADQRYEKAIEAALGGNVNNVVVENADVAKSAIGFLKENRAGRVTFLPLDTIRPSQRDDADAFSGRPGIIGPAMDFARFDGRLTRAMQYLFHNTVIVESIDVAIAIARGNDRYPRMVTLDGEVVSPAGAVTGAGRCGVTAAPL
ncbi:MAG: chromosome segregation protein SMC, partial [Candidatus Hydrogenedentota bacterium]